MGFVGNYAPRGLSPQMYGMPVIQAVTAGSLIGDRIEVLSGLQAGDSVIVAGLINVSDGLPVKTINE